MELRKDYILDKWVIIAKQRHMRPNDYHLYVKKNKKVCAFCPGQEKLNEELWRVPKKGKWQVRVIKNKYPAVTSIPEIKPSKKKFYTSLPAYGNHEIIIETRDHKKQLWDFDVSHLEKYVQIIAVRTKKLMKRKHIKSVQVFKNHGKKAGASIVHSHTQIIAYNKTPHELMKESKNAMKKKKCQFCMVLKKEKDSQRFVKENDSFIAFCPYASQYNYEIWLFPKKHKRDITTCTKKERQDLAALLKPVLQKLKEKKFSYNMELHQSSKEAPVHLHIRIHPRIGIIGGFEVSTGDIINTVSPEEAARFYRR